MLIAACIGDEIRTRDAVSIRRIGERHEAVTDADSRTQRIEPEIIIDIFLVLIEIIDEYLCGVRRLPIHIGSRMRHTQGIGLQVVTDERAGVILVKRRGHHHLVRKVAGDDAVEERRVRRGFYLTEIIDIDSS